MQRRLNTGDHVLAEALHLLYLRIGEKSKVIEGVRAFEASVLALRGVDRVQHGLNRPIASDMVVNVQPQLFGALDDTENGVLREPFDLFGQHGVQTVFLRGILELVLPARPCPALPRGAVDEELETGEMHQIGIRSRIFIPFKIV